MPEIDTASTRREKSVIRFFGVGPR